jgi:2-polyprenyl-6-methoxyphenol hydroxylase-like FAD-dependent oxidoreductase
MYDVIVVGARVAGASTAMLMARRGLKVLVVDRAEFGSDTLSTYQVQVPGVARLARWGLLERLEAAGTPATRNVRFDPGPVVLEGRWRAYGGVDAPYSPRRTLLDKLLVDAAREAGAEVRERFAVDELTFDGDRVTEIRGRAGRESARLVVGAAGRHSLVAKAVAAAALPRQAGAVGRLLRLLVRRAAGGRPHVLAPAPHGRRLADQRRVDPHVCRRPRGRVGGVPRRPGGGDAARAARRGRSRRARAGRRARRARPRQRRPAEPLPRCVRPRLGAGRRRRAADGPDHRSGHRPTRSATRSC